MGVLGAKNREKWFAGIGIDPAKVVDIIVSHQDKIMIAKKSDAGKFFEGYDAVITKDKDIALGLTVADCLPVVVFNPANNSIALVHCGWRNLENGLIKKSINILVKGKSENRKLIAYIGPHICQKHYEIKTDVYLKFTKYKKAIKKTGKKIFLDLGEIAKAQLIEVGVKEKNITIDGICTFESNDLFSFRRGDLKNRNLYLLTLNNG